MSGGQDHHRRRAVQHKTGAHLLGTLAQKVFHRRVYAFTATQYGKNSAYRQINVNI